MKRNSKTIKTRSRKHSTTYVSTPRGVFLSANQIQRLYNRLCKLHEEGINNFNECLIHLNQPKIYYNDTLKSILRLPDLPKVFILPKFMLKHLIIAGSHPTLNWQFNKICCDEGRQHVNALMFGYRSVLKQRKYFNVDVDGCIIKDEAYQDPKRWKDYIQEVIKDFQSLKFQAYNSYEDGAALVDYLSAAEDIEKGVLNHGNK